MEKRLFTSECVTNGHPDKVADSISDAILDAILEQLEGKDISLEDSFALYQKGMELVKTCNSKIDTVEKKMITITK